MVNFYLKQLTYCDFSYIYEFYLNGFKNLLFSFRINSFLNTFVFYSFWWYQSLSFQKWNSNIYCLLNQQTSHLRKNENKIQKINSCHQLNSKYDIFRYNAKSVSFQVILYPFLLLSLIIIYLRAMSAFLKGQ